MPKTLKVISIVLFFISLFPVAFSQAQTTDSIRFVTYYPSPYGSYAELRTKKLAVGAGYINAGDRPWNDPCNPAYPDHICGADLVVEGNVGIGTTQPGASLHIYGGNGMYLDAGTTDGTQLNFITYGDGTKGLDNGDTKGWHIYARGNAYASMLNQENDLGLGFYNGLTALTVMHIDSLTGNVGIGTTSPGGPYGGQQAKLDVNGYAAANDVWLKGASKWASQGGGTPTGPISMTVTKDQNYQISTTKDAFLYITSGINQAMKVYLGAEPVPSVLAITLYSPNSQWGSTVTLYVPKNWYFRVWTNALDPAGACYVTLD